MQFMVHGSLHIITIMEPTVIDTLPKSVYTNREHGTQSGLSSGSRQRRPRRPPPDVLVAFWIRFPYQSSTEFDTTAEPTGVMWVYVQILPDNSHANGPIDEQREQTGAEVRVLNSRLRLDYDGYVWTRTGVFRADMIRLFESSIMQFRTNPRPSSVAPTQ